MKKTLLTLMILGAFSPMFASAQVAATPTDVQSIVQMITDLQVQLLLAKIAELKAEIAKLMESTNQVVQNTTPVLGAQPVSPAAPSVVVPTVNISLGETLCIQANAGPSREGVTIPYTITGGEWLAVGFKADDGFTRTYIGGQTGTVTELYDGTKQPFDTTMPNKIDPTKYRKPVSDQQFFFALNVPGTFNYVGKIYGTDGSTLKDFSGTYTVPNSCRTALADQVMPIKHKDGTWNGQLQSDGTWINTTTVRPY